MRNRRIAVTLSTLLLVVGTASGAVAQGGKRMPASAVTSDSSRSGNARAEFQAAMPALTANPLSDGAFIAMMAPSTANEDAARRIDLARYSGSTTVIKDGASYTVLLCQVGGPRAFTGMIVFRQRTDRATSNPNFDLPDPQTTVSAAGGGVVLGSAPTGSLKMSLFGHSVSGIARLKFAQARLPGAAAAEPVEVGISFRGPIQEGASVRRPCAPPK